MPDYAKKIVYLSEAQYQELITNQTITVNGITINYDENTIYMTPQNTPLYAIDLATLEEVQAIIDEWEDEGMVFETTFTFDATEQVAYWETVANVSDIVSAYTNGKNVVIHLVYAESFSRSDAYFTMVGYVPETTIGSTDAENILLCNLSNSLYDYNANYFSNLSNTQVVDGKLRVYNVVD